MPRRLRRVATRQTVPLPTNGSSTMTSFRSPNAESPGVAWVQTSAARRGLGGKPTFSLARNQHPLHVRGTPLSDLTDRRRLQSMRRRLKR